MAEMKASIVLELVDRLTGKAGAVQRSLDKLEGATARYATSAGGLRASSVRVGGAAAVAARSTAAQTAATEKLNRSQGRYNSLVLNLRKRAEGGGPSEMALARTHATAKATEALANKTADYINISRRASRVAREAAEAEAKSRGIPIHYTGIMRRSDRPRGGAFSGAAEGVAAARWARRGHRSAGAASAAEASAVAPRGAGGVAGRLAGAAEGVAPGIATGLAIRGGVLAAGAVGGAVAGAVGLVAAATPHALALERSMEGVRQATGASRAELDQYERQVLNLARTTGRSKEDIASLMAAGASDSRRGQDLADYAGLAARASQVWGQQARTTGEALSELGSIYRANQQRLEGITDAIQTAAGATRTRAADISGFLREVGQEGRDNGLSAEQLAAYGAAMRATGTDTDTANKAMSSILSTLGDATEQGRDFDKALRSMGLRTRAFAQAMERDANGAILDFMRRLHALDADKRNEAISNIFGDDQAEAIRRLAEQVQRVRDLQGQIGDRNRTRGALGREFAQFSQNDFAKNERAQQNIDTMMARLGYVGKMVLSRIASGVNVVADAGHAGFDAYQQSLAARDRMLENRRRGEADIVREGYDRQIAALDAEMKKARENYDFRRQEELALQRQRLEGWRNEARVRDMEHRLARRANDIVLPSSQDITRQIEETNNTARRQSEEGRIAARRKFFDDVLRHGAPHRPPEALRRQHDQQRQQATAAEVMALERRRSTAVAGAPQGPDMQDYLRGLQEARGKVELEAANLRTAIDSLQDAISGQRGGASSTQAYEMRALHDGLRKAEAEANRLADLMSQTFPSAVEQGGQRAASALDGTAAQAHAAGVKIAHQLGAGITAGAPAAEAAMHALAGRLMRHVPQSPAKEGPLRRLGYAGEQIVEQLAAGMGRNDAARDAMRSAAGQALAAVRPNAGAWPTPRPANVEGLGGQGASDTAGGSDRSITVNVEIASVTVAPNGQSLDDLSRSLGERVAARLRSSLHESRP